MRSTRRPTGRNRPLWVAALLSLALHVVLGLYLAEKNPPALPSEQQPIEVELISRPRPSRPSRVVPPSVQRPPQADRDSPRAQRSAPPVASQTPEREGAPSTGEARADAPRSTPGLILTPRVDALPWKGPEGSSGGRTLHPDDPSLSPEALREEERARVGERVQTFAEDQLAEARAQRGLPHPYLEKMRASFLAQLGRPGAVTPRELGVGNAMQAFSKNYRDAASQFGRTGNPGFVPPSSAPTQSEVLDRLYRNVPEALPLRMQVQARETMANLEGLGPMFSVKLEVIQRMDGTLVTVKLLESSGSPAFDAYVLKECPGAIRAAVAPPGDAFRKDSLRSVWAVEGWFHPTDSALDSALPALQGVPVAMLLRYLDPARLKVDFRAKLLRVY